MWVILEQDGTLVNLDNVSYICRYQSVGSAIHFTNGAMTIVRTTPEDIRMVKIKGAREEG